MPLPGAPGAVEGVAPAEILRVVARASRAALVADREFPDALLPSGLLRARRVVMRMAPMVGAMLPPAGEGAGAGAWTVGAEAALDAVAEECGLCTQDAKAGCEGASALLRALRDAGTALCLRVAARRGAGVEVGEALVLDFRAWVGPAAGLLLALCALREHRSWRRFVDGAARAARQARAPAAVDLVAPGADLAALAGRLEQADPGGGLVARGVLLGEVARALLAPAFGEAEEGAAGEAARARARRAGWEGVLGVLGALGVVALDTAPGAAPGAAMLLPALCAAEEIPRPLARAVGGAPGQRVADADGGWARLGEVSALGAGDAAALAPALLAAVAHAAAAAAAAERGDAGARAGEWPMALTGEWPRLVAWRDGGMLTWSAAGGVGGGAGKAALGGGVAGGGAEQGGRRGLHSSGRDVAFLVQGEGRDDAARLVVWVHGAGAALGAAGGGALAGGAGGADAAGVAELGVRELRSLPPLPPPPTVAPTRVPTVHSFPPSLAGRCLPPTGPARARR